MVAIVSSDSVTAKPVPPVVTACLSEMSLLWPAGTDAAGGLLAGTAVSRVTQGMVFPKRSSSPVRATAEFGWSIAGRGVIFEDTCRQPSPDDDDHGIPVVTKNARISERPSPGHREHHQEREAEDSSIEVHPPQQPPQTTIRFSLRPDPGIVLADTQLLT